MFLYGMVRYASIRVSAMAAAVDTRPARIVAIMPELKPATIAEIPIARIVIAIRSSTSANPFAPCVAVTARTAALVPDQLPDVGVPVAAAVQLARAGLCCGLRLEATAVD